MSYASIANATLKVRFNGLWLNGAMFLASPSGYGRIWQISA